MKKKQSISGKRISKKGAFKGLGNPKTWPEHKEKIIKEFKQRPQDVNYPEISKLGVTVYYSPVAHIKSKELMGRLTKIQREAFSGYFGTQTCPLVDGVAGLYPWDVEAVLVRMFKNELTGTQHPSLWD